MSISLAGVIIRGGPLTFIFGGLILSILLITIKPLLNIISLPLNLLTLGFFSFFVNSIILYLLTLFITDIKITPFTFSGLSYGGFIIPRIYFNGLTSFIACAAILSISHSFLQWLFKD